MIATRLPEPCVAASARSGFVTTTRLMYRIGDIDRCLRAALNGKTRAHGMTVELARRLFNVEVAEILG